MNKKVYDIISKIVFTMYKYKTFIYILFVIILVGGYSLYISNQYQLASEYLNNKDYNESKNIFERIGKYKDSEEKVQYIDNCISYIQAQELYDAANYEDALDILQDIPDLQGSDELITECKYELGKQYMFDCDYSNAKKYFLQTYDYLDSKECLAELEVRTAEESKNEVYKNACSLYNAGNYKKALEQFSLISSYKDSKKRIRECKVMQQRNNPINVVSAGIRSSAAIIDLNCVKYVGSMSNGQEMQLENWKNIRSIECGGYYTIGLTNDKKIKIAGDFEGEKCTNFDKSQNYVDISAGMQHILALDENGKVYVGGFDQSKNAGVQWWSNIMDIAASGHYSVGLTSKNMLVFAGDCNGLDKIYNADKAAWKDVVSISAGGGINKVDKGIGNGHVVGLKKDGSVVAIGDNTYGQCDVSDWKNIVKISAGDWYTVGLDTSGNVYITGENRKGMRYIEEDELQKCENVVDISAGFGHILCLKNTGELISFGFDEDNKSTVPKSWNNIKISDEIDFLN